MWLALRANYRGIRMNTDPGRQLVVHIGLRHLVNIELVVVVPRVHIDQFKRMCCCGLCYQRQALHNSRPILCEVVGWPKQVWEDFAQRIGYLQEYRMIKSAPCTRTEVTATVVEPDGIFKTRAVDLLECL